MESAGSLELCQLARPAHHLPYAIVQKLRLAVGPRNKNRLDCPLDVRLVSIRFAEFEIAAGFAADTWHDVVSAILRNRRVSENALTFGFALSTHEQEEMPASVGEIEPERLFLRDDCVELDWLRLRQGQCAGHEAGQNCKHDCELFHEFCSSLSLSFNRAEGCPNDRFGPRDIVVRFGGSKGYAAHR